MLVKPRDAPDSASRVPLGLGARTAALAQHRESRHAVKYSVVGVSNVIIDMVVFVVLLQLGVWYVAAKVLSESAAILNGYTFNRRWTFRAGAHRYMKLLRYVTIQGTGLLLNLALLTTLVEIVGLGPVLAAVIALPPVAAYCFLGNRLWTFGQHVPPADAPPARRT